MTQKFTRSLPLPPMLLFAVSSLAPLVLLLLGLWLGGFWLLGGLAYMAGLTFVLDRYVTLVAPDVPEAVPEAVAEPAADTMAAATDAVTDAVIVAQPPDPLGVTTGAREGGDAEAVVFDAPVEPIAPAARPAPPKIGVDWLLALAPADKLLVAIGVTQLLAMPVAIWAIAGNSGVPFIGRVLLFLGFGQYLGQVCNSAAHELIHRGDKRLFQLGMAIYTSLLFGHHTSAHRLVHHRFVGSIDDPNSARGRESFYKFAPRAWMGSFRAGLDAENTLRAGGVQGLHPYVIYLGGAAFALVLAMAIAGFWGLVVWVGLALYATSQLLLGDYVQHFGLTRARLDDGKLEPIAFRHSWNAPHWFSSAVMLNAPRHSDHHAHPTRPYPNLVLPDESQDNWLPYSLPVCCAIALYPRRWRQMMTEPLLRLYPKPAEPEAEAAVGTGQS